MTHPNPGPDRRSVSYWAGWCAVAAIVIAVISAIVAHNDAENDARQSPGGGSQSNVTGGSSAASNPASLPSPNTLTSTPPVGTAETSPAPAADWASAELLRIGDGLFTVGTATMDGKRYPDSILFGKFFFADPVRVEYNLARKCSRFKVTIGLADDSGTEAVADLKITADGRKLWARSVKFGDRPTSANLKVSGVLRLTISGTYNMGDDSVSGPVIGMPEVMCNPVPTTPSQ